MSTKYIISNNPHNSNCNYRVNNLNVDGNLTVDGVPITKEGTTWTYQGLTADITDGVGSVGSTQVNLFHAPLQSPFTGSSTIFNVTGGALTGIAALTQVLTLTFSAPLSKVPNSVIGFTIYLDAGASSITGKAFFSSPTAITVYFDVALPGVSHNMEAFSTNYFSPS